MELVSMIFLCVILFENVLAQPMQHVIPGDQVISTGQHIDVGDEDYHDGDDDVDYTDDVDDVAIHMDHPLNCFKAAINETNIMVVVIITLVIIVPINNTEMATVVSIRRNMVQAINTDCMIDSINTNQVGD
uniref:Immunogenic miracidial antigen 8I n=1 Tax=Schistosoma japonicum TaxID=6182 RepID=A1YSI7_SCHJA|nr:unknown [Schistosoma japonicum]